MIIPSFEAVYGVKEAELSRSLLPVTSRDSFEYNHKFLVARMGELLRPNRMPSALVYLGLLNKAAMPYDLLHPNQIPLIWPHREAGIEFVAATTLVGKNLAFSADMGETSQDVDDLMNIRQVFGQSEQVKQIELHVASVPVIKDHDRWLLQRINYSLLPKT